MNSSNLPDVAELLPHRDSMLLLNEAIEITDISATALVKISADSSFYMDGLGVPACIGLEYMGQTAALIAGLAQRQGQATPQLGFLLGSRHYQQFLEYFVPNQNLQIIAQAVTAVGIELASFECTISDLEQNTVLCRGSLSVMRKPISEQL